MELKFNSYKEFKIWFKKEIDTIGETMLDNIQFIEIRHLSYIADKLELRAISKYLEINYEIKLVDKITTNEKSIMHGYNQTKDHIMEIINDNYATISNCLVNINKEKLVSTRLDMIMSKLVEIFNNYEILDILNKQTA